MNDFVKVDKISNIFLVQDRMDFDADFLVFLHVSASREAGCEHQQESNRDLSLRHCNESDRHPISGCDVLLSIATTGAISQFEFSQEYDRSRWNVSNCQSVSEPLENILSTVVTRRMFKDKMRLMRLTCGRSARHTMKIT